eukprot:TRINITY_DN44672_c0_g1_i1.p1 TRINITY_DN44672_c0_g1~~TRINITY_DN44672_c0_g1_i1.p1  ORF type:complete len:400 (+),score=80.60 TRINITY_DN44672_c0_g1_i1:80-1279(+)
MADAVDGAGGEEVNAGEWQDLLDGKIQRRTLRAGTGPPPEIDQDIVASIDIMLDESGEILQRWKDKRYRIGEGEAVPMLELGLRYTQECEECEIRGSASMAWGPQGMKAACPGERVVPPDVWLRMRVVLHRCVPKCSGTGPSWDEKMEQLVWRKANGNDYFKRKQFRKALISYTAGVKIFGEDFEPPDYLEGEERTAASEAAKRAVEDCACNLAATYLEEEEFSAARDAAGAALELNSGNVKALYRQAKAHLGLRDFETCDEVLKRAQLRAPDDASLKKLASELKRLQQEYVKTSRAVAGKMFSQKLTEGQPLPSAGASDAETMAAAPPTSEQIEELEKEVLHPEDAELERLLQIPEPKLQTWRDYFPIGNIIMALGIVTFPFISAAMHRFHESGPTSE